MCVCVFVSTTPMCLCVCGVADGIRACAHMRTVQKLNEIGEMTTACVCLDVQHSGRDLFPIYDDVPALPGPVRPVRRTPTCPACFPTHCALRETHTHARAHARTCPCPCDISSFAVIRLIKPERSVRARTRARQFLSPCGHHSEQSSSVRACVCVQCGRLALCTSVALPSFLSARRRARTWGETWARRVRTTTTMAATLPPPTRRLH